MFTRITAPSLSGTKRLVALWPERGHKEDDVFRQLWRIVDDATDSVVVQSHDVVSRHASIMKDQNLSEKGRRAMLTEMSAFRATIIQRLSKRWVDARDLAQDKSKDLVGVEPYKASEPWRWHQDLEVARMVREMTDSERRALLFGLQRGQDDGIAEAMLRVPRSLSGMSAEAMASISAAIIDRKNPGFGEQVLMQNQALLASATAIQSFGRLIVEAGVMTPFELDKAGGAEFAQVVGYAKAEGLILSQYRQGDTTETMQQRQDAGIAAANETAAESAAETAAEA